MTNTKSPDQEIRRDFTKLPGELRNLIYHYVLTSDRPFEYQTLDSALTGPDALNKPICLVQENHSPRTSPDWNPILRVDLVLVMRLQNTPPVLHPFNPLKQVSRLLRSETSPLDLHHATIHYAHPTSLLPLSTLAAHIHSAPNPWLTSLTVLSPDDLVYDLALRDPDVPAIGSQRFREYTDFLCELDAFCRAYPRVEVGCAQMPFEEMRRFHGRCGYWTYVMAGMLLTVVFDRRGEFATRVLGHEVVREDWFVRVAVEYAQTIEEMGLFKGVGSLRMYQGVPQVMKELDGEGGVKGEDFEGGEGGVKGVMKKEEWAEWAMKWAREGIRPC